MLILDVPLLAVVVVVVFDLLFRAAAAAMRDEARSVSE